MNKAFIILLILNIIGSIYTIYLFSNDKKRAINHEYRIKESRLLLHIWLFGAYGSLIAIFGLRHKSKHSLFVLTSLLATILHTFILIIVAAL